MVVSSIAVPIDIDEFESASEDELVGDGSSITDAIVDFLSYNPEQAYSRQEIQSAIDVDAIALVHELTMLEQEGIVRHKGRYWAIDEEHANEPSFGEPL